MTFRIALNQWTAGECSELLEFRSDIDVYMAGARQVRNFKLNTQGPLSKRHGFQRIQPTSNWDSAAQLWSFQFSNLQNYLLAAGNNKLRIYKSDALQIELSTPWADADLQKVKIVQSFDTALFFHPDYETQKLLRQGSDTSWTLSPMDLEYRPFYRFTDAGSITLTPSATTGTITLTASAALFSDSSWIDIRIRLNKGIAKITAIGSSTSATATVETTLANTTVSSTWEEQSWSSRRGWPSVGHFHASRLIAAGSRDLPQTIWASRTGLPFDFNDGSSADTVKDDDGFDFNLGSSEVNAITDLYSIRNVLQIFTTSAEWICDAKPVTPSNVSFAVATREGMSTTGIRVVSIDSESLFLDKTGSQIRGFSYDFSSDAFVSRSKTLYNPEIANAPTHAVYLKGQSNFAVFRNTDGGLVVLTIDASQKVLGWTRWNSAASFRAITVVGQTLYVIQDFNSKRYITKLTAAEVYLDLYGVGNPVSPATNFSGFTTFANQSVTVVADGYEFTNVAVDGTGAFTLPVAASQVYVGLPFTATYESLPLAPAINGQLQRGNRMRKILADVTVRNTKDLWIDGEAVPMRKLGVDALDSPVSEKNTTFRQYLRPRWSIEQTITIESRSAKPLTLIGVVAEIEVAI